MQVIQKSLKESGWSDVQLRQMRSKVKEMVSCFPTQAGLWSLFPIHLHFSWFIHPIHSGEEKHWILEYVATLPEFRGRGVMRKLLLESLALGSIHMFSFVCLYLHRSNCISYNILNKQNRKTGRFQESTSDSVCGQWRCHPTVQEDWILRIQHYHFPIRTKTFAHNWHHHFAHEDALSRNRQFFFHSHKKVHNSRVWNKFHNTADVDVDDGLCLLIIWQGDGPSKCVKIFQRSFFCSCHLLCLSLWTQKVDTKLQ